MWKLKLSGKMNYLRPKLFHHFIWTIKNHLIIIQTRNIFLVLITIFQLLRLQNFLFTIIKYSRFDSEKYPRSKDIRKKSDFEYNVLCVSGKRSSWIVPHGLDLKRVKLDDDEDKNRPPSPPSPHKYLEKNIR